MQNSSHESSEATNLLKASMDVVMSRSFDHFLSKNFPQGSVMRLTLGKRAWPATPAFLVGSSWLISKIFLILEESGR